MGEWVGGWVGAWVGAWVRGWVDGWLGEPSMWNKKLKNNEFGTLQTQWIQHVDTVFPLYAVSACSCNLLTCSKMYSLH